MYENTPKCPRIYLPNLSAQAQKFWISMKKGLIGFLAFRHRSGFLGLLRVARRFSHVKPQIQIQLQIFSDPILHTHAAVLCAQALFRQGISSLLCLDKKLVKILECDPYTMCVLE
jgi:hypothetical protein